MANAARFVPVLALLLSMPCFSAPKDLCDYGESQLVNTLGGVAGGTAFTASMAGESIVLVAASNTTVFVGTGGVLGTVTTTTATAATAAAVAPAIALTATTAAAAYVTLKAWCSRHVASDAAATWYQSSVNVTSSGMEIAVDTHGKAVGYTSRVFEGVAGIHKKAVDWTSGAICSISGLFGGNCR